MIKLVIWDFDGTIADSFGLFVDTFRRISPRHHTLTTAEIDAMRDQSLRESMRFLGIRKWQIPWILLRGKLMLRSSMRSIEPFDGLEEALRVLKGSGYEMIIVSTNSTRNIDKFLRYHGLSDIFSGVHGNVRMRGKSRVIRRALRRYGLEPNEAVYIGDESRDIKAAHCARVHAFAVSWGFQSRRVLVSANPDALIDQTSDIVPQILARG